MKKFILSTIGSVGYIVKYGCVAHCMFEYVGDFVLCSGPSMEPTIVSDDILLTEHISVIRQRISRGDVIIAKCPTNPKQQICKRVIGLPGDKIKVGFASSQIVPIGHVWLQGDNAGNSTDSRNYGPVPQGLIRSRAICKVWPLKSISTLTE
ncbi:hypothetical protein NQ315_007730 [Exocentrus adspersus]|uniref:Mitochondrial inner membrane protease subunit n=1 Tax=Exocentrus adspersus TaxID=1586481 RepID=A0AAV8W7T9_9CUCU|nr:hypothetical protein NQ315_007730 [Exocentrus adspersus]